MVAAGRRQVDAKTRDIVEAVVRAHAGGRKLRSIEVRETDDADFPGLKIDVYHKASVDSMSGRDTIDMLTAVGDALLANDDARFPYIEHHFENDRSDKMREHAQ